MMRAIARSSHQDSTAAPGVLEVEKLRLRPSDAASRTSSRFSFRERFPAGPLGLVLLCLVSPTGWAAEVAPRSASGQTLQVPQEVTDLGETYYLLPGVGTQFSWQTDAPMLRLDAACDRVVGFLVAPFELQEDQSPLLAGQMRVPVASLSTGYETDDAMLHGLLGREACPEILLSLVSAGPAREVREKDFIQQCTLDLVMDLTVNGTTVRFTSPAELALLPFANATQRFSPSDLITLRSKTTVALADLGIKDQDPGFVGTEVEIELYFMGTTIPPEKNLDPRTRDEIHVKQLMFLTQVRDFNDPENGYEIGRSLLSQIWQDPRLLNDFAWLVLTDEHIRRRDLALVDQAIQRANDLTGYKDATCLHTLARLHYERGDLDGALRYARLAVDNLEGQPFYIPPPIRAALQGYEAEAERLKKAGKADQPD